ncbi:hypothetical protein ACIQU1_23330 [Streptomyces angustmyceticus]|uniref:hypothetical protein n=1 Tax=Streptomyces angustmyceticus TaxID=285578 RepID=UPI003808870B
MTTAGLLREAAALLKRRAAKVTQSPDERWMVDEGGLVLGAFTQGDVEPDGTVGTGVLAWFAYPGNPERATHTRALGTVAHVAALDPLTAVALSIWLETTASFEDRAEELEDLEGAAPLVEPAAQFLPTCGWAKNPIRRRSSRHQRRAPGRQARAGARPCVRGRPADVVVPEPEPEPA